jgi:hypothetical protein
VAVLGFGGWLVTRGEDDTDTSTVTASETAEDTDPATTERDKPSTTSEESVERSSTEEATSVPPTATAVPEAAAPSTASPPTGPPVIVPPPLAPDTSAPDATGSVDTAVDSTPPETADAPGTTVPTSPSTSERPARPALDELVPNLAGHREFAGRPDQRQTLIDGLLASPRHDVASRQPIATLCAVVALDGPIRLGGRWEVDGRPLASSDPIDVGPPGFGECVDADGDALADGAYQFVAVDPSGASSAAGTFVVGADPIGQAFRNNGDEDVCAVLVGPASASFYEAFRLGAAPIEPGAMVTIVLGSVRQDVRTIGCDGEEVLAEFSFDPSADEAQDLMP